MLATDKFSTADVAMIENFYPIVTDAELVKHIECANCEFKSIFSDRFVEPNADKTVCIVCDQKGVFICAECDQVHKHESECGKFSYSTADPLEIVNHIYDQRALTLP